MDVPILTSLQIMLKNTDVLERIKEISSQLPGQYVSHCSYYQENQLLSVEGLKLFILLYIGDFEITNSLMGIKKSAQSMWNLLNILKPTS